ncbi:MAG: AtpZ/AtpI family protein [Myxococcaceae bacterium]|nr:AtpZ/AtpI family protein [Myxococcaceae bacterium]MBR2978797.1 AtpZ/AtpI family protein [Myxococcaceae bacterium]
MTKRAHTDGGGQGGAGPTEQRKGNGQRDAPDALSRTASGLQKELQKSGDLLTASWQLVASILLPTLLGWWLDGKFGARPWLMLTGAIIGIAVGLFGFIRTALASGRSSDGPSGWRDRQRPPSG